MSFTQNSRRNLIRRSFITLLMPQVQRLRSKKPSECKKDERDRLAASSRLRIRNKFWLAVTLRNNPELRVDRRRQIERETETLGAMWERLGTRDRSRIYRMGKQIDQENVSE